MRRAEWSSSAGSSPAPGSGSPPGFPAAGLERRAWCRYNAYEPGAPARCDRRGARPGDRERRRCEATDDSSQPKPRRVREQRHAERQGGHEREGRPPGEPVPVPGRLPHGFHNRGRSERQLQLQRAPIACHPLPSAVHPPHPEGPECRRLRLCQRLGADPFVLLVQRREHPRRPHPDAEVQRQSAARTDRGQGSGVRLLRHRRWGQRARHDQLGKEDRPSPQRPHDRLHRQLPRRFPGDGIPVSCRRLLPARRDQGRGRPSRAPPLRCPHAHPQAVPRYLG